MKAEIQLCCSVGGDLKKSLKWHLLLLLHLKFYMHLFLCPKLYCCTQEVSHFTKSQVFAHRKLPFMLKIAPELATKLFVMSQIMPVCLPLNIEFPISKDMLSTFRM